jgi:release factor glutamine methyltransferase
MKTEAPSLRKLSEWLDWGARELAFLDESEARRECEAMIGALLGTSRIELYLQRESDPGILPQFSEWVRARQQRVPLAYLLKRAFFWDDEFEVEEGVFIPRPDTETLIEAFLAIGGHGTQSSFRFLDLGTGSGNIAVTVAKLFPQSTGVGTDISRQAVSVAQRNGERAGISERIQWVEADGLRPFAGENFDVIFSNPPYVATGDLETIQAEVRREPQRALDGGRDGLDFYRRIFEELSSLRCGGSLWVEIGEGERLSVLALFEKRGFQKTATFKDLHGISRVIGGIGFHG